jgi:5'-AMP-activated protein kinase catalytic alpha subunit
MPDHLSDTCKDFLRHILVPDWSQRYKIEEIRAHPWYNIVNPNEKEGIILGQHEIPIDDKIIQKMEKDYSINVDKAK